MNDEEDFDKLAVQRGAMSPGTVFWVDPKDDDHWTIYQVLDRHTEVDLSSSMGTRPLRHLGRSHADFCFLPVANAPGRVRGKKERS